jgi:hypothetical protein
MVSRRINSHFRDAKEIGRIRDYPSAEDVPAGRPGTTIVQIYFVGYFEGKASRADVRLFHRNQVLASPMIDSSQALPGQLEISGSDTLANLLFKTDDPRLARYRRTAPARQEDLTLTEAIEVARNYIRACNDPIAKTVDEKCGGIGGHTHIATVTSGEGFKWVDPPTSL